MSFFADEPASSEASRKRREPIQLEEEEDEIEVSSLSSEEDSCESDTSTDEKKETAQEKKLRVAKIYVTVIKRQEKKRKIDPSEIDNSISAISKYLNDDYMRKTGKLKSLVAHKYKGVDIADIKVLQSKHQKISVTCLRVTGDGKFIFSASKNGTIIKWCLTEQKYVASIPFSKENAADNFKGHSKRITGLAVSDSMRFLAVSDESNDIQVWDPVSLEHLKTLTGHSDTVTDVVFRREIHTLYSSSKDSSLKVWCLNQMVCVETLFGHRGCITSVDTFYKDRVVTSGRDATVRMWKISEEAQLVYAPQTGGVDVVKLINEDNFVSGGDDGILYLWAITKKKPLYAIPRAHGIMTSGHPSWIVSITCLMNTDLIATGSVDGSIIVWRLGDSCRTCEMLFKISLKGFINSLAFTPDGRKIIAGIGREHKLGRWHVNTAAIVSVLIIPLSITEMY